MSIETMRIGLLLGTLAVMAVAPAEGAGTAVLSVSAVVLSNASCVFQTASNTMSFGSINPASTSTVFQSVSYRIRCTGPASKPVTFALSDDSGLHESGPGAYRMRHTATPTEYLPYSLVYPSAMTVTRNVTHSISVTGTLTPTDFQNAAVGNYADTVTLTIIP